MTPEQIKQTLDAAYQHHRAGRLAQAEPLYRQVLAQHPDHADAMHHLGMVAYQCGLLPQAIELMARSIALKPGVAFYHKNLGEVYRAAGQFDQSLQAFADASTITPPDALTLHAIALTYEKAGRIDQAIAGYRAALQADPRNAPSALNLGVLLERRGVYDESLRLFEQALAVRGDYPAARMARAVALLRQGRYEEGWRDYEWRWAIQPFAQRAPDRRAPVWDGAALAGRTLLLRYEQGLGDTLQFIRYAPVAARLVGRVIVEVQSPLKSLLARLPSIAGAFIDGEILPPFDVQAPIMSLPRIFRTTPDTIPTDLPYLVADPARADAWRNRLASLPGRKIGLVWGGNPSYPNDHNRSMPLSALAPLAAIPNLTFISLQKGPPAAQAAAAPAGMRLVDWTNELHTFADTADLVAALDRVVTVDTSVGHLAGGLGKPYSVLIPFVPDFRWFLNRADSPWYPTATLYRQEALGDWSAPLQRLAADLARFAAQPAPDAPGQGGEAAPPMA